MERRVELNLLLDCYGPLLTASRAQVVRLYCEEDLSLQEIADAMGITRQAVHDAISRATAQLDGYEAKLGMVRREWERRAAVRGALDALGAVRPMEGTRGALERAIEALSALDRNEWMEG